MLTLIFFVIPTLIVISVLSIKWFGLLPKEINSVSITMPDLISVYLLHFALSGAYIMSYPAVEAVSPSLTILLVVKTAMPYGLTFDELSRCFDMRGLLNQRIQDLIDARLVVESNSWFRLTCRGDFIAQFFLYLRKLLGLPVGKG
jgi:hypothetical protein